MGSAHPASAGAATGSQGPRPPCRLGGGDRKHEPSLSGIQAVPGGPSVHEALCTHSCLGLSWGPSVVGSSTHRTPRLRERRTSSRRAKIKLQPGSSKAKAPPPGCHLSVCPLTQAGHHLPTILSVHLSAYTYPPTHPSLHLSAHLFAGRASNLSLHLPTSFLLSIHPSVCIFPFIHCSSLSRPSSSQTMHPSITHPHLCLSIHALVLTPFQSFSPSIHLPNPPFICLSSWPSTKWTSRKISGVDIKAALRQEKLRPGILHTRLQNQIHLWGAVWLWEALVSSGSQSPVCMWKARGRDACPADTSQHAAGSGQEPEGFLHGGHRGLHLLGGASLASPMGQGPTWGGQHHPGAPGPCAPWQQAGQVPSLQGPGQGWPPRRSLLVLLVLLTVPSSFRGPGPH